MSQRIRPLSPLQERFVLEMPKHNLIGAKAYIAAGGSTKAARQSAHRYMADERIRLALAEHLKKALPNETQEDIDENGKILREIDRIAFSDLGDIYNEDGTLKPLSEMPEDARRALSGIETSHVVMGKGDDAELVTVQKVKLWNKNHALEQRAKIAKLIGYADEKAPERRAAIEDMAEFMVHFMQGMGVGTGKGGAANG